MYARALSRKFVGLQKQEDVGTGCISRKIRGCGVGIQQDQLSRVTPVG